MKEPARLFIKVFALTVGFIHNVKWFVVLSKRSLINSDSFQLKIELYLKLFRNRFAYYD
jgi:hypothetical protein